MARGLPERLNRLSEIKSATLFETQSRDAAARLAKRVGTDMRATASKVAQQAGFKNVTEAMGAWLQDEKSERVLFRDFLTANIKQRLGDGGKIPTALTPEGSGKVISIKSKINELDLETRQRAGFGAAEGSKLPDGYKKPRVSMNIDGNAFSVMGAVSKAIKSTGNKELADQYIKEATSGDYDNLLRVSMKYVDFGGGSSGKDEDEDE